MIRRPEIRRPVGRPVGRRGEAANPRVANLTDVEDFAVRFADLLEQFATRVRGLTVDRAERAVRIVSLVFPVVLLAVAAVVFLFMTLHSALAIPLGQWGAYAVEAGLFGIGGAFLWWKRTRPLDET